MNPVAEPQDHVPPHAVSETPSAPDETVDGGEGGSARKLTMFELARLEEARRHAAAVDDRVRESGSTAQAVRRPWRILPLLGLILAGAAALRVYRLYRPTVDAAGAERYAQEGDDGGVRGIGRLLRR